MNRTGREEKKLSLAFTGAMTVTGTFFCTRKFFTLSKKV